MIKKFLGIAPKQEEDGSYSPSPLALKMATSSTTDYDLTDHPLPPESGKRKILMLCTEEKHLTMKNGRQFSTGNHPVEMLVPLLHFRHAGFETDVYTPTGQSVKMEMWAFPDKDEAVKEIFEMYTPKLNQPKSLSDFVNGDMKRNEEYLAVFIPGGHGALLGLPDSKDVGKLVKWTHAKDLLMLAICHGPAAFLSAGLDESSEDFIYRGYKMAAFPDSIDEKTPMMGYMPGHVPWKFGEKLKERGVEIVNKMADKTCHTDRNLITGASPLAANDFGKMAAKALLEKESER
ncbi:MAG TPA: glyoxalase III HchA [Cryomorphaceae bacterium]|nr:glyoxalase III HchA [Cryomorphaceae bacterium]